jgi:hypothetical protein
MMVSMAYPSVVALDETQVDHAARNGVSRSAGTAVV